MTPSKPYARWLIGFIVHYLRTNAGTDRECHTKHRYSGKHATHETLKRKMKAGYPRIRKDANEEKRDTQEHKARGIILKTQKVSNGANLSIDASLSYRMPNQSAIQERETFSYTCSQPSNHAQVRMSLTVQRFSGSISKHPLISSTASSILLSWVATEL